MNRRKKLIIAMFLVAVPVALVLYVNYLLNNLVSGLYVPVNPSRQTVEVAQGEKTGTGQQVVPTEISPNSKAGENEPVSPSTNEPGITTVDTRSNGNSQISSKPNTESGQEIVSSVQQQLNRPVDKQDLLKAATTIMRKLSWEEIGYLYSVGNEQNRSPEELKKTREVLLQKLTPQDVEVLRALGKKYGKTLNILDPSVPIE